MFTAVRTSDTGTRGDLPSDDGLLTPGAMAGPWRIEHEFGRGGMGTVYAVTHQEIGKRAALKVAHAYALTPWFTAERFLLEARVVNQVAHPAIVDIFETGMLADGRPYLVMERLDGLTLAQRFPQRRVAADEVCAILLEVCAPIRAAHAANVVHRDLKLDNIFLVSGAMLGTPIVKVLDWGIAKILSGDPSNTFADRLVGTPRYLSPEQARGAAVTTKADIYSLGVIAYELFLQTPPFAADSAAELVVMHVRDLPPPPHETWPGIPRELESLLLAMLEKDPADRPTIDEVAERLRAVRARLRHAAAEPISHKVPVALLTGPTSSRRARVVRSLAVVALLGVVVAASPRAPAAGVVAADTELRAVLAPASVPARISPEAAMPAVPAVSLAPAPTPRVIARLVDRPRTMRPVHHREARRHVAVVPHAAPVVTFASDPRAPIRPRHASTVVPRRMTAAIDPDGTIEPYR